MPLEPETRPMIFSTHVEMNRFQLRNFEEI